MLSQWTSREKKLIIIICILVLLLLSMLFSAWLKKEEPLQSEFPRQTLAGLAEEERQEQGSTTSPALEPEQVETEKSRETVMVDIKGAVQKPYVYLMDEEERVIDVINKAGGLEEDASTMPINLAQKVFDGMVIYIPTMGELDLRGEGQHEFAVIAQNSFSLANQANPSSGKININTATASELETLPGIGPSRAQAIISHREEQGLFTVPEDLMKVSGIGTKIFANLKDEIEVR